MSKWARRLGWRLGIGGGELPGSAAMFTGSELCRSVEFMQGTELRCVLLHDVECGPSRMSNGKEEIKGKRVMRSIRSRRCCSGEWSGI